MGYNTVTITTSATKILSMPANAARNSATVENVSLTPIFIGLDSSVTTSNGTKIITNGSWETNEPRTYQGELWGIVASGTADVRYIELL